MNYLVAYDYSAGRADRYTVLVLNADDPVTIGREVDLPTARTLLYEYEAAAKTLPNWTGHRRDVLQCLKQVSEQRLVQAKKKT